MIIQGHVMFEWWNTSCHFTCCYYVTVVTPMSDCSWKTLYTVSRGQAVDDCLDGYSQTHMLIQHAVRCCTAGMICGVVGLLLLLLLPKTNMEMLSMFPTWRWVQHNKSTYWLIGMWWVRMDKKSHNPKNSQIFEFPNTNNWLVKCINLILAENFIAPYARLETIIKY
jgi:hypothetical protein